MPWASPNGARATPGGRIHTVRAEFATWELGAESTTAPGNWEVTRNGVHAAGAYASEIRLCSNLVMVRGRSGMWYAYDNGAWTDTGQKTLVCK